MPVREHTLMWLKSGPPIDRVGILISIKAVPLTAVMLRRRRCLRNDGGPMNTETAKLSVMALGWAFSAALVVLFVLCLAVALVLPEWQGSHAWIGIFSTAPMRSARVWVDGIVFSIVFGW